MQDDFTMRIYKLRSKHELALIALTAEQPDHIVGLGSLQRIYPDVKGRAKVTAKLKQFASRPYFKFIGAGALKLILPVQVEYQDKVYTFE